MTPELVPPTRPARDAWFALGAELDDLAASGRRTPCQVDPGPFFADDRRERSEAAAACPACPVLLACARLAYENRESAGVWAGVDLTAYSGRRNPRPRLAELLELADDRAAS